MLILLHQRSNLLSASCARRTWLFILVGEHDSQCYLKAVIFFNCPKDKCFKMFKQSNFSSLEHMALCWHCWELLLYLMAYYYPASSCLGTQVRKAQLDIFTMYDA